jgi:hypothetical protein
VPLAEWFPALSREVLSASSKVEKLASIHLKTQRHNLNNAAMRTCSLATTISAINLMCIVVIVNEMKNQVDAT